MKKRTLLLAFLLLQVGIAFSQTATAGCQIRVKLNNYHSDTLWFGHTFGKRAEAEFSAVRQADGWFEMKQEAPLAPGMYAFMYRQTKTPNSPFQFIQCWLAEGQRTFSLETSIFQPYKEAVIIGSRENVNFYDYLTRFHAQHDLLDSLNRAFRYENNEASFRKMLEAEAAMQQFQDDYIRENEGSLSAYLVKQTQYLAAAGSGQLAVGSWQEEAAARWHWQRQHFLEGLNLDEPNLTRCPQWIERLDFFLMQAPPPHPDTLKALMDNVLTRLEAKPDFRKYYLRYLVRSLNKMSQFRSDEAYAWLVRTYLESKNEGWGDPAEAEKFIADAVKMEALFVGKTAPDVTLFDRKNQPVRLHSVAAPFTLMVFWLPDCSHCKRELPLLQRLYPEYQAKGLKVMSVCGKSGESAPSCWEYVDSQAMPADWLLLSDPERRSGMSSLFNVRSYPRLILLDANKKIIYKRAGEATEGELRAVLEEAMGLR